MEVRKHTEKRVSHDEHRPNTPMRKRMTVTTLSHQLHGLNNDLGSNLTGEYRIVPCMQLGVDAKDDFIQSACQGYRTRAPPQRPWQQDLHRRWFSPFQSWGPPVGLAPLAQAWARQWLWFHLLTQARWGRTSDFQADRSITSCLP